MRVACTLSKRYEKSAHYRYWYAYHPRWNDFLSEARRAHFVLGCMDLKIAFAIPVNVMRSVVDHLHTTEPEAGKFYWHVHIAEAEDGKYFLRLPKNDSSLPLSEYQVSEH